MLTAQEVIEMLKLESHPSEGGYFRETYRSGDLLPGEALPERYGAPRPAGTAIYYLLTPQTRSVMHRLKSAEVWHFYVGGAVEVLQLPPGGEGSTLVLGSDLAAGQRPQAVVPAGVWQGARLLPGGAFALMGTTVAPGYEPADFEAGDAGQLTRLWPACGELIRALT